MRSIFFLLLFLPAGLGAQAQPFTSSDLPIVQIETNGQSIPDEFKITANLTVIDNGPGQRNFVGQTAAAYTGLIGLELHGNSTQQFPKKSMKLETRDADGEDLDVSLLGMPETSDYVLTANYSDKTLMRNALAYELGRQLGQYAPRTRFCEVLVNNVYQGVYTLTERIKRGNDRVDMPKLAADDTSGVQLTGGYIVSIDWVTTPNSWRSDFLQPNNPNNYTPFQHEYPRWDEIRPVQAAYIKSYVDSFETALASANYQDTSLGWRRFADEKSFIDFFIVNELSRNIDAYRLSTYFHKQRDDKGGKIKMGPLWDFDLAWYNANYCQAFSPSGWAYHFNYICPGDIPTPFWWERLMSDRLFQQHLACRWQSLRQGPLQRERLLAVVDSMALELTEAQQRNFQKWQILGVYVWPNPGSLPTTYFGEVQKMKAWITSRLDWLDLAIDQYTPNIGAAFQGTRSSNFQWQFSATPPGLNHYSWNFGDSTTLTGASVEHTFAAPGHYPVALTVTTAWGCTETVEQVVTVIDPHAAPADLRVWPNPAHDWIELEWPSTLPESVDVQLENALGQRVFSGTLYPATNRQRLQLPTLPAGTYALRIYDGVTRLVQPLVIR